MSWPRETSDGQVRLVGDVEEDGEDADDEADDVELPDASARRAPTRSESTRAATARPRSPAIRIGRRGSRSTQTPAGSAKSRNGSISSAPSSGDGEGARVERDDRDEAAARVAETCEPNWLTVSRRQRCRKSRVPPEAAARPEPQSVEASTGDSGSATPGSAAPSSVGAAARRSIGSASRGGGAAARRRSRGTESRADRADQDRLAQADPRSEGAAGQRSDRDRAPDDEAHDGVHPSLQPRRADRLPVAHLHDVVDDDREAEDELRGDEERESQRCRRARSATRSERRPEERGHDDRRRPDAEARVRAASP